jgi:hypothetical protein
VLFDRVVPRRVAREHEEVQSAEQAQRHIPLRVVAHDRGYGRIVRKAPAELRVQSRAALALPGLLLEDVALAQALASSADFAC